MLKGNNNKKGIILKIYDTDSFCAKFYITFPAEDTYYLYIDNVKQNVYIEVRNKDFFTSQATSISPNIVSINVYITYTLTVDTNFGIAYVDFFLKSDLDDDKRLICKPDSSDNT